MLGIYDYTVVLTYVSLMVSIGGMMLSVNGHLNLAVLCLAISGLCDMFDGKIARTKKDRTEEEKCFGIQIDSLCDIVCFGVGPAIICYCIGMRGPIGMVILMFYVLAGLIRLAWFNVTEECRQKETDEKRACYQGLPITSMAIILPLVVVFRPLLGKEFMVAHHAAVLVVGLLFIQYIQESVQIFMIVRFNFDLTGSLSLRCNGYFSSKLLFQFFFNILVDYLHGFIIYFFGLCRFM